MECPNCGCEMEQDDEGLWYCENCDETFWYNPFSEELESDDYVPTGPDKDEPDELEWSDL